jgi:GNAT superfamily N-acetyltransferase
MCADDAYVIRVARDADVPALSELIPLSVRALSRPFYTPFQIELAVAHVFGVDRQLIADGTYFVAETPASRQLVGCGGWSRRRTLFGGDQTAFKDQTDAPLDPRTDAARIRAFFVHPSWVRRGIARRIAQESERAAARAGFSRVELVATLPGEPLYAALGYSADERIEIAIGDHALPAVKMRKKLA